jgi:preprotein translocase subunit YajC
MLNSPVFAQAAGGGGDVFMSLLPLVLIFVVFYFLLIRPQQKRVKEHKAMVEALRRGDRVVTGGGIVGKVSKVLNDSEVQVEIAENVKVRVQRQTITAVLSKTEAPADDGGAANDDDESDEDESESKKG